MFTLKADLQSSKEFDGVSEIVLTLDHRQLTLLTEAINKENLSRSKPTSGQDWDAVHLETKLKEILKRVNKFFG